MSAEIFLTIYRRIKQAGNIIILTHKKPDGDTLGAALALAAFLTDQQIQHQVFNPSLLPEKYLFLPGVDKIIGQAEQLIFNDQTLIIALDTDITQTGLEAKIKPLSQQIINIDHHFSNSYYGGINLVEPEASSTCELIYNFFISNNIRVTPTMATSLYSGIYIDTGSFTNAATNIESLAIAGHLLSAGARFRKVARQTDGNQSISGLKLWGLALSRLYYSPISQLVVTVILEEDLASLTVTEEELDGIANFLNRLHHPQAKAVMVLRQDGELVRGSLRTTRAGINVARLAEFFGGGGHKKAAGFKVQGKLFPTASGWRIQ